MAEVEAHPQPPPMQRRHYVWLAAMVAEAYALPRPSQPTADGLSWAASVTAMACAFAEALAESNPRFDRARFLRACGAPPWLWERPGPASG